MSQDSSKIQENDDQSTENPKVDETSANENDQNQNKYIVEDSDSNLKEERIKEESNSNDESQNQNQNSENEDLSKIEENETGNYVLADESSSKESNNTPKYDSNSSNHENYNPLNPYELKEGSSDSDQTASPIDNIDNTNNIQYVATNNNSSNISNPNYDQNNPYDINNNIDESHNSTDNDEENVKTVANRSIDTNSDDNELSVSSGSKNVIRPASIVDVENADESGGNDGSWESQSFFNRFKWAFFASIPTLVFIIISSAIAGGLKKDVRLHIVPRTLEIVNKIGGYVIWGLHCASLLFLPWLFTMLFKDEVRFYQIWAAPVMMLANMIGGFLPIKGACYPLIIELLISVYLLFHAPFEPVYIPKRKNFLLGELTLMSLGFIYISSALGASTLTYMLYGSFIRVNKMFAGYPSNPHYAIEYFDYLNSIPNMKVNGQYLACYSLFTFLSVGIGFAMSMKNSILMSIPFCMLCICTVIETHGIGILLFCQLLIHIIYITCLHFPKTRRLEAGCCCNCCYECCYATLTTVMFGDIIGFCLFAFPILQLSVYKDGDKKFPWGGFIGGSVLVMVGVIFHIFFIDLKKMWENILAAAGFVGASIVFGVMFGGYVPMIRAFTYECTYVMWSLALCFWGYSSGYSPLLFKVYNTLISLAALAIIELYEGIGWIEIVFAVVQVVFDTYFLVYVQRDDMKYIAWTVFSVAGILVLGVLVGVCIVIILYVAYLIISTLCSSFSDAWDLSSAQDYAENHHLKSGDVFECAGKTWIVN